jgi:GTP cyclohydrolase II
MAEDQFLRYLGSQVRLRSRTWGPLTFEAVKLSPAIDGDLAVYVGSPLTQRCPLIRIHSECVFAEAFDSALCDCADQLKLAMRRLIEEGNGILLYLRLDGRGAGLTAKVKATALEVGGVDTFESRVSIGVEPEGRDFRPVADFLKSKKITSVRLLTNNPEKAGDLVNSGIAVAVEPLVVRNPSRLVRRLYQTKRTRFGHTIPEELIVDPQTEFDF